MRRNILIQSILILLLPSAAYAHGEQIAILLFSDAVFVVLASILLIFVKFRYASKTLLFAMIIVMTLLKYLLPFPQYILLLEDSILLKSLAVVIHIGPTILICWIATVLLKRQKIKKDVQPKY